MALGKTRDHFVAMVPNVGSNFDRVPKDLLSSAGQTDPKHQRKYSSALDRTNFPAAAYRQNYSDTLDPTNAHPKGRNSGGQTNPPSPTEAGTSEEFVGRIAQGCPDYWPRHPECQRIREIWRAFGPRRLEIWMT